jgi:1-acyl-sn-glycerol-3-phosphate acyltransferase
MKDLAAEILSGEAVAFFPEGTRSPDGEIGQIRPGIALLIRRTKVPVVPVAIDGAFECWPRHRKIYRHGRVRVVVGEPIRFPARAGRKEILGTLRERLVALREEAKGLA